jgi:hypothetical protein
MGLASLHPKEPLLARKKERRGRGDGRSAVFSTCFSSAGAAECGGSATWARTTTAKNKTFLGVRLFTNLERYIYVVCIHTYT